MSYNLIFNDEFTNPIISTDSFLCSKDFTIDQKNNFYWSYGIYACIQNGNTAFNFPDQVLK